MNTLPDTMRLEDVPYIDLAEGLPDPYDSDIQDYLFATPPTHVFIPTHDGRVSVMTFDEYVNLQVLGMIEDGLIDLIDPETIKAMSDGMVHRQVSLALDLALCNGERRAERILREYLQEWQRTK